MNATDAARISSLADLKAQWPDLNDVDRALAVHALHGAKVSLRQMAKELGCSPTLLRNLARAAQASAQDLNLARQGKISTRELVQRARAAAKLRTAQDREALDRRRTKAAEKAAKRITSWLEEEHNLWPAHGEKIVDDVRRIVAENEADGTLDKLRPFPQGTPLAVIIERTTPKPQPGRQPLEAGSVGYYAEWLARWAFYAFPDPVVRDRALGIALDYEIRGIPVRPI